MQKAKIENMLRIFLILSLIQLWGCQPKIANLDSKGENIICFGDSITQGTGASEGNDYPALLAQKLNMKVINAGVSGDTTRDALKRIEEDVLRHNPRMVIIEFCGNDFLQSIPIEETFDNLDKMAEMVQQKQAIAVLAEVAAGRFGDAYLYGFKQIAEKRHAMLIPHILQDVFSDPSLKSDWLHPNDAGYRIIADRIYKAIKPLLN
jgi:lysophospholipase L1-like esterase